MLVVVGIMRSIRFLGRNVGRKLLRTNKRCQILLNVWYRNAEPAAK